MNSTGKTVLYIGLAVVLVAVIVGVYFYTLGQKDLTNASADYAMTAKELYADFDTDEQAANDKYLDKIIEVSGKVSSVEMSADTMLNVMLMSDSDFGGVQCTFNNTKDPSALDITKGDNVVIRGICSGMLMDVQLHNCVLVSDDNM